MYKLIASKKADRQIKNLPRKYQESLVGIMAEIKEDPESGKALGREFKGYFSYKLEVYRVIYKIYEKDQIVRISKVEHRSTVYN